MNESPAAEVIETGIKAVDLFAPLVRGGTLSIGGPPGAGQVVLALEIVHNLIVKRGCRAVFTVPDVEFFRNGLRESGIDSEVKPGAAPGRIRISEKGAVLATIVLGEDREATSWALLSVDLLKAGQLPAIDATRSASSAALPAEHTTLAAKARDAIAKPTGARAGFLLAFLRQWFSVGEPWTGQPAEYSSLTNTLAGARRLLGGQDR